MIKLGEIQKLEILRKTPIGAYLNTKIDRDKVDILLPKNQVSEEMKIGEEIEVFVYKDSEDRIISTIKKPKIIIYIRKFSKKILLKSLKIISIYKKSNIIWQNSNIISKYII